MVNLIYANISTIQKIICSRKYVYNLVVNMLLSIMLTMNEVYTLWQHNSIITHLEILQPKGLVSISFQFQQPANQVKVY